jgi:hypothetical protein
VVAEGKKKKNFTTFENKSADSFDAAVKGHILTNSHQLMECISLYGTSLSPIFSSIRLSFSFFYAFLLLAAKEVNRFFSHSIKPITNREEN